MLSFRSRKVCEVSECKGCMVQPNRLWLEKWSLLALYINPQTTKVPFPTDIYAHNLFEGLYQRTPILSSETEARKSQAVSTLQNYLEKAIKSYLYSRTYNITVSYIVNILTVSVSSITIFKNSE